MITTSDSKNIFNGNGSNRSFAFAWKVQSPDDLAVYHVSSTGVETLLTYNSHYLVTLNIGQDENPGGTVTFPVNTGIAALPTGEKLVVTRGDQLTQPSDVPGSTLLEEALDKLTALAQQLQERIGRTMAGGASDTASLSLGTAAQRANRVLTFDSNGAVSLATVVPDLTLTEAELLSVLTGSGVGGKLYPRTAAEIATGINPADFTIPELVPDRYTVNATPGTTNMTTAVQASCTVAAAKLGATIQLLPHKYLCTANITVPVAFGQNTIDFVGTGRANGGLVFDGAAVTTGLTYSGSGYYYAGTVKNLRIICQNSAKRGVTFNDIQLGRIENSFVTGAAGAGVMYANTLMCEMSHTLVTGCGSATEGSVEVDGAVGTTFRWDHNYISGGNTTVGGLIANRTSPVQIIGGAIESCGIPIRICNKAEASRGCVGLRIRSINLENPGNNNPYIELGAGLSGSAFVVAASIRDCVGFPSGTTQVDSAIEMTRTIGFKASDNNWSLAGTPVSMHELLGTANGGVQIAPHKHLFTGGSVPWVRINGTQVKAAGPHLEWNSEDLPRGLAVRTGAPNLTGATPSVRISAEGGFYRQMNLTNGGATTITALTGGEVGMEIEVYATNGNTTLTHSTSNADQFRTVAGANLVMQSGTVYRFVHDGTLWMQVS